VSTDAAQDSHNGWRNGWPDGIGDGQVRGARFQRHDDGTATSTVLFDQDGRRRGRFRRRRGQGQPKDRAARWLRNAMIALGVLAVIAAVVSFAAQYHMVLSYKGVRVIAALEAGIPDVSAVVFASLGIALALHGKRAIRARLLNVGAVATSIGMNWLAAAPGWRGLAIWVMPPIAYALASDTAIGVIRAWTIARAREMREDLADDEATPLAILGGFLLWVLRLVLAPPSTVKGFRRWVVESCPVAPGRTAALSAKNVAALPAAPSPGSAATAKPQRRGGGRRRGPGRDWDALSDATRKRYAGAGIDQAAYESGADISAARGHRNGGPS
jgi:hypothetical protein